MDKSKIGIVFGSLTPPEGLTAVAARAEQLGFGEVWFSEDCFFTGGVSGLTLLLAATERVPAGLGLASVVTRHPAMLAMELAGLARIYPGRVRATIGLGNGFWLQQLGLTPAKPLTAVKETLDVLRELLAGGKVNRTTSTHHYGDIKLEFPPEQVPQLWFGAVNEKALRVSGEKADGVLLSVLAGPSYITWARGLVDEAGRDLPLTAFVLAAVDDDDQAAREAVRGAVGFFLKAECHTALVGQSPFAADIRKRVAALGPDEELIVEDKWVDEFAVAGSPLKVRAQLQDLLDAGATSLSLWLFPPDQASAQLERLANDVLTD
ncbi:LLM class flavin-dependent oxidoreductase [Nocardia sp. NPDC004168]|uniref:LLM class flavin-dependent oxidoreductase n=1 Tax=Nocardia sp. NPDC004168 TaxID=3154452 RepID=UPI0033AA6F7B